MPRPLLFAPCVQPIISKGDEVISLISVIEGLNVAVSSEQLPPADAMIPSLWHIFTMWRCEPTELGRIYTQRVEVFQPDGSRVAEGETQFTSTTANYRTIVLIDRLFIGQPGQQTIRLSLQALGEGEPWQVMGEYPIDLKWIPASAATPEPA